MLKKLLVISMIGLATVSMSGCESEPATSTIITEISTETQDAEEITTSEEVFAETVDDINVTEGVTSDDADEVIGDFDVTDDEEVIGDFDAGEISAKNCKLWQLGFDVANRKINGEEVDYSYTFLFPDVTYVTSESAGYLKADGIVIDYVDISLSPIFDAKPGRDILYEADDAFISRTIKYDSISSYKATYILKNGEDKLNINLEAKIKISSTEEEQAFFRAFVEEYVPAFEASLIANLAE